MTTCDHCRRDNPPHARFCGQCGKELPSAASDAADAIAMEMVEPTASPTGASPQFRAPAPQLSIMAVMSLVLSFLGCLLVPQMVSLVLGVVALRRIRRSQGMLTGRGFAVGGICVSSVVLLFIAAIVALPIGIAVLNQPAATLTEAWRIDGSPSAIEQQPDGGDMAYGAESAGPGIIDQLAYSSDGELLVGRGNALYVWDAATGREQRRIDGFDFTGRFIVDGDRLRAIRVRDSSADSLPGAPGDERLLESVELDLRGGGINVLASCPWKDDYTYPRGAESSSRGGRVAVAFDNVELLAWDAETGREISRFQIRGETADDWYDTIVHVTLSPDGRLALVASGNHSLLLVDVQRAAEIRRFEISSDGPFNSPTSMFFTSDGKTAITVHSGSGVPTILWDVESGRELRRFDGHNWGSSAAALSTDGRLAVTGGRTAGNADYIVFQGPPRAYGGDVVLWNAETESELDRFFKDSTSRVSALALSPDGSRVAAAYDDGTLIVLDTGR